MTYFNIPGLRKASFLIFVIYKKQMEKTSGQWFLHCPITLTLSNKMLSLVGLSWLVESPQERYLCDGRLEHLQYGEKCWHFWERYSYIEFVGIASFSCRPSVHHLPRCYHTFLQELLRRRMCALVGGEPWTFQGDEKDEWHWTLTLITWKSWKFWCGGYFEQSCGRWSNLLETREDVLELMLYPCWKALKKSHDHIMIARIPVQYC